MSALDSIRQRVIGSGVCTDDHPSPACQTIQDRARLLAALDAVLALHQPVEVYEYDDTNGVFKQDADGEQIIMATLCSGCTDEDAVGAIEDCEYNEGMGGAHYPCPTVAAVNDALEAGK